MAETVKQGTLTIRGMNDAWVAGPDEPELLENVYLDAEGAWRTCGGYDQVLPGAFNSVNEVLSLHFFAQHNGARKWLVCERVVAGPPKTLTLGFVNFSAGTIDTIQSGRTYVHGPTAGSSYVEHAGWLYVLNGYDAPIRWNGKERVRVGFDAAPPAPDVAQTTYDQADRDLDTGAGVDWTSGWQRGVGAEATSGGARDSSRWLRGYATTWINDLGQESPRSEIAWVNAKNERIAGSHQYGLGSTLVRLQRAPGHVRGQRLWGTINTFGGAATESAPLYLLAEFGTGGAVDYTDDHPDSDLILPYVDEQHGLFPGRAQYMALFKGCAFYDDGTRLRYSAAGRPEQTPAENFLVIGDTMSGNITGLRTTKNALVVTKQRGVYLIKGDPVNGFYQETVSESEGNVAPRSLLEVPGLGMLMLSEGGPRVLVGALEDTGNPTELREIPGIGRTWRKEVNRSALVAARGAVNTRDREVWIQVPTHGDDRPKLGLVLHYATLAWSLRRDFPFACLAAGRDHQARLFAGSWDTSENDQRGIHVVSRGYQMNGSDVASVFRSPWLRAEDQGRHTARWVELHALTIGREYELDWRNDRSPTWTGPSDSTTALKDYERVANVWGGSGTWEETVPMRMRLSVRVPHSGHEFQFRVTGAKIAIRGYVAEFVVMQDHAKRGPNV